MVESLLVGVKPQCHVGHSSVNKKLVREMLYAAVAGFIKIHMSLLGELNKINSVFVLLSVWKKTVPRWPNQGLEHTSSKNPTLTSKERHRLYRERLKQDPQRYRQYLARQLMFTKRYQARKKLERTWQRNQGW